MDNEVFGRLFNVIFGLLSDKVRSLYSSNKLKEGDLTEGKYKTKIVRELDEIKFKLEPRCSSLLTSISFLQAGVRRLQMSLGEYSASENPLRVKTHGEYSAWEKPTTSLDELTEDHGHSQVEHLAAILKLNIESDVRFEGAKESFKQAGNEATRAFHNVALGTEDRILASKLRIASGILGHLNDLRLAASDCLLYLEELHDMPAIQAMFAVHVRGGIKSHFNRTRRTEIVETVTMINLFLANFVSDFTKRRMAVFDWPMIKCGKQVVHPIHYNNESSEKKITPPWDIVVLKEEDISKGVLNSKGDFVGLFSGKAGKHGLGKLNKATGEVQLFFPSPSKNIKIENIEYSCVAVDEDDMVYFLSWYDGVDGFGCHLSVYTEDGNIKYHCELNVHIVRQSCYIAVTKDKKIVICGEDDRGKITVYLCKISDGQQPQIESFTTGLMNHSIEHVFLSCDNEIIVATINVTKYSHVLYIYTEDGQLQRTVEFRSSEGNNYYYNVCYDQLTKNIIGFNVANTKCSVKYLSGVTGEVECSYMLLTDILENPSSFHLACHRNGALALVSSRRVLFLQAP